MYLYAPDGVGDLLLQSDAGTEHLYQDGKGSTRLVVNNNGTKTKFDYDAFGNPLASNANPESHIKHRYVGEVLDEETGFYYFRARHYDPKIGRFISRDSFEGMKTTPISLNPYLYAHADPVNMSDPTGHFGLMDINISQGIQSTLNYMARDYLHDYIFGKIFEGTMDQPGLSDIFTMMLLKVLVNNDYDDKGTVPMDDTLYPALLLSASGFNDHHTIPKYMCGPDDYTYTARIDIASHSTLHTQMYLFDTAVKVGRKGLDVALHKKKRGATSSPLIELAVKPYGRLAITSALHYYYYKNDYLMKPVLGANRTGTNLTPAVFYSYFVKETERYVLPNAVKNLSKNQNCINEADRVRRKK
ncbi:RHS repeat-associated core domain-containing protein [Wohlfahrtiimonas larvae]|uniref:RHS repeat-associated core domain-containing protein n=1 Tax=Wohlfahrtiimonas larvae TaxID=1157986 RepID=A0ABP9MIW9_9GAMM|nr:RHS repeat-associated core domain-containing protein [Wohlfahrtiimonas larvae]